MKNYVRLTFAVALAVTALFTHQEAVAVTCDDCVRACLDYGYCNGSTDPNCVVLYYPICRADCAC